MLIMASAYSWSVGSLLFLASWAVLMGPIQYAQHLLSAPRLPFTAAYFGSIVLTLLFAVKVRRPQPSCALEASCPHPSYQNKLTSVIFPIHTPLDVGSLVMRRWSADRRVHMIAPKYHLNPPFCPLSVGRPCMVSCQLFSHGQHRFTLRRKIRNQQGVGLDVGLEA